MKTATESRPDLKPGDMVLIEGITCWVAKKEVQKCLKYPGMMGWSYFVPEDWSMVTKPSLTN